MTLHTVLENRGPWGSTSGNPVSKPVPSDSPAAALADAPDAEGQDDRSPVPRRTRPRNRGRNQARSLSSRDSGREGRGAPGRAGDDRAQPLTCKLRASVPPRLINALHGMVAPPASRWRDLCPWRDASVCAQASAGTRSFGALPQFRRKRIRAACKGRCRRNGAQSNVP